MRSQFLLAAILVASLTGCGGDDTGASGADGQIKSGDDLAAMVGCTGFSDDSEEIFVTEGGPCSLNGKDITVYYFAEESSVDDYLEVATGFGGLYLVGPNWLVEAPRATLAKLKGEHGGTLSDE